MHAGMAGQDSSGGCAEKGPSTAATVQFMGLLQGDCSHSVVFCAWLALQLLLILMSSPKLRALITHSGTAGSDIACMDSVPLILVD